MKDDFVIYNGQQVFKKHFRAFLYHPNGQRRVANSWQDFSDSIASGVWFDDISKIPKVEEEKEIEEDNKITLEFKPKKSK